jgi:periplasmic protein TonB
MKRFFALFIILLISYLCYAGISINADTIKKTNNSISVEPAYPGGLSSFDNYIRRNLHYPWPARLMCINGNVYVSFAIDRDGKVTDATPENCIGAGCESEAVKVVTKSRRWKPGLRNGMPVRVNYTIPIAFVMKPEKIYMENLKASGYGFVFSIKGILYSIDEAEEILGKTFKPEKIETAEPYYNYSNDPKFQLHNKKEVYLILIKPS